MNGKPTIISRDRTYLVTEGCAIDGYPFRCALRDDLIDHNCKISNIEISWKYIGSGASIFQTSKVMTTRIICAEVICSAADLRFSSSSHTSLYS